MAIRGPGCQGQGKTITAACGGRDRRRPENLAKRGDLHLQVVLFDHQAGPDQAQAIRLWRPIGRALDQRQQHVESPVAEHHGAAFHQQPALVRLQLKGAKSEDGGHGGR